MLDQITVYQMAMIATAPDDAITSFTGCNRFLSNFYLFPVQYKGEVYASVEYAYQAAKTTSKIHRVQIQHATTPGRAKRLGQIVPIRSDWKEIKLSVMEKLLYEKFSNDKLWFMLHLTKPLELIEGNTWNDKFWGQCPLGNGENHLGKLLMKIRDEK